jgi:predicted nucleic acid-binding protein
MHAPAHVDVEVMSALGRLQRGSLISKATATRAVDSFLEAPIQRHDISDLARGAWSSPSICAWATLCMSSSLVASAYVS